MTQLHDALVSYQAENWPIENTFFLVLKQFSQIRRCKWEVNPWTMHILCKMFIHATEKAVFQFIPEYAGKECFRTFALVAFNAGQSIK